VVRHSILAGVMSGGILFCNPMLFQFSGTIHHYIDRFAQQNPLHLIIIYFLVMPELMHVKKIVNGFKKGYLMCKESVFIFFDFPGECKALIIGQILVILPVFVQSCELSPRHLPRHIAVSAEHMRVNAADRKPLVIDPAPAVLKKPA